MGEYSCILLLIIVVTSLTRLVLIAKNFVEGIFRSLVFRVIF